VWHGVKHDDAEVTELEVPDMDRWVEKARLKGGFWLEQAFIPWHRIHYVELTAEPMKETKWPIKTTNRAA